MAISIVSLALLDPEFGKLLIRGTYVMFVRLPFESFQEAWWKGVEYIVGASAMLIIALSGIAVSLYLPFTKHRFDRLIVFVTLTHCFLIFAANFQAAQTEETFISSTIMLLTFIWMTGFLVCVRFDVLQIVTDRQASRKEGVLVGAFAVAAILVCALFLKWHWAHSYAFAAVWAIAITQVLVREKEAAAGQVVQPSAAEKY